MDGLDPELIVNLVSQIPDIHINNIGITDIIISPDFIHKLVAGNRPASMFHQIFERIKFLFRQRNRIVPDVYLPGSRINPVHLDKISPAGRKKRDILFAQYTELRGGERIVKEDVCFESPSGAAQFCVGGSSNGWSEWKDEAGQELKVYRE